MNIHPLWFLCLIIRFSLIFSIYILAKKYKSPISIILLFMGLEFVNNYITGSNNEIQIANVFWHDTRLAHGLLFILSTKDF